MIQKSFITILSCLLCASIAPAADDLRTAPVNAAEIEAHYTDAISQRATDIIAELDLKDATKASAVQSVIVNQYRALRARDAVIDGYLRSRMGDGSGDERVALYESMTRPLHKMFVATLAAYLTPEQVEIVKDKMTYKKVQKTFEAYCNLFPKLTDEEKAMVLAKLKAAREQAMDEGSSTAKHAVFDQFKQDINADLKARGHDVDEILKAAEFKKDSA